MAGRAWVFSPVKIVLTVFGPPISRRHSLADYLSGILDTLDGSSGFTFTYLPIVFEDDSQVSEAEFSWVEAAESSYRIKVQFL